MTPAAIRAIAARLRAAGDQLAQEAAALERARGGLLLSLVLRPLADEPRRRSQRVIRTPTVAMSRFSARLTTATPRS